MIEKTELSRSVPFNPDIRGAELAQRWLLRLSYCLPLVFLIGAPTILITRMVFFNYYPSHFYHDSPTISETSSLPPANLIFEVFMLLVTVCIFVSWTLVLMCNSVHLSRSMTRGASVRGPVILSWSTCATGIAAGAFLGLISIYNLNDAHDIHMFGSWAFYLCQAFSIIFDILFVMSVRGIAPADGSAKIKLQARATVASIVALLSLFFLVMYETKGYATPQDKYATQLVYVSAEYAVCMFFLAYPTTVFFEMRGHLRQIFATQVAS